MRDYITINSEFSECIWSILNEPTAPDVEYYFFRMGELVNGLRKHVEEAQLLDKIHKEGNYE